MATAIVTGASQGLGAALAAGLADAGWSVVIDARHGTPLEEAAAAIRPRARAGAQVITVVGDVTDPEHRRRLVAAARSLGGVDLVVNNVGGTMPQAFMDTSAKIMEDAFHFNVATAHTLLHAAVPLMLEGGGGSAVNISSAMGRLAGRGFVAYGTAKGALAHYTRLSAMDLAPRIRVNAIAVGSVATSALDIVMQIDEMRVAMEDATPLGRIGAPEDIAAAIVYLASDAGCYITGKIIEVDGGTEAPTLDMGIPDV